MGVRRRVRIRSWMGLCVTPACSRVQRLQSGTPHASRRGAGWEPGLVWWRRPLSLIPSGRGSGSCSVRMSRGLEKAQRESEGPGKAGGVRLGLPGACPHSCLVTQREAVGP